MIVKILVGLIAYAAFVLMLARMLSDKWHPDGGRRE